MATSGLFQRNTPPARWIVSIVLTVAAIAWGTSLVGEALLSQLVDRSPLWLVALNPTNKNLILVNGDEFRVDATPYYLVGFIRHISTDPFFYLIGLWYGDKAINWASKVSKSLGTLLKESEKSVRILMSFLVFLSPVSIVCLLAGGTGLRFRNFIAINAAGTAASLVLIRWLGDRFGGSIDGVVNFISTYRWQVFAASILYVLFTLLRDTRGGSNSPIAFIRNIGKKS